MDKDCPFTHDETALFVISALKDPLDPTHCSGALNMAVLHLMPSNAKEPDKNHLRRLSKVLKSLFAFITAKRNPSKSFSFMSDFASCAHCHHNYSPTDISSYFHMAWDKEKSGQQPTFETLCTKVANKKTHEISPYPSCSFISTSTRLLNIALTAVDFKASARGVSKLWPSSLDHLIPHTPNHLVQSIMHWHSIYPAPSILGFLSTLARLLRTILHQPLIANNFTLILILSTKRVVDACLSTFVSKSILPHTLPLCDIYSHQSITFFDSITALTLDHYTGKTVQSLLQNCETKAIQLASLILYLGPRSFRYMSAFSGSISSSAMFENVTVMSIRPCDVTTSICKRLKSQILNAPRPTPRIALPIVVKDHESFFGNERGFEPDLALAYYWCSGITLGCFNSLFRSCDASFEALGCDLRVCDRCLSVYYCSRRCQRRDWGAGDVYAHKNVCGVLRKVVHGKEAVPGVVVNMDAVKVMQARMRAAGASEAARIRAVRMMVRRAMLSQGEMAVLAEFGREMYRSVVLEEMVWSRGFDDYEKCVDIVTDRATFAVAGSPQAVPLYKVPKDEVKKEKSMLLARKFWQ
ncbi:hypothetical protein CVT24_001769 [Panaeolus cyanescens]|uniref:MYND-type domain-containing protein n=1 Tax=Panaeolus cyanescens TaxID=181874 RepID=A0A409YUE6_9AGAR|nr:hypothetical protein CVT24_001769 [Panaeolus cyanescens]